MPINATNLGSVEFGRAVRRYHKVTSAKRGPDLSLVTALSQNVILLIPEVIAMKTMKNERSG